MKTTLATAAILVLTSSTSFAAPTVDGNTITWPDDGWYQVQRTDNYETICGGTSECVVEPGNYVVINHTTGERFVNIMVGTPADTPNDPPTIPSGDTIVVSGNRITWPDDGWYQVQNAETYDNICGGTAFCDVEPGNYVVINHTTGVRFDNILVGAASNPANEAILVSGNTITWPDDGWYQVQTSDTYESVCNGGTSCDVPNGVYTVINHTTGQRFSNILVSAGAGLKNFDNGDAFYTALREALINRPTGYTIDYLSLPEAEPLPAPLPSPDAAPQAPVADSPDADSAGNDVTTTNVQEAGVDEQDRVKVNAAGTQLFVLNNDYSYYGPEVFPLPIILPEPEPAPEIDEIELVDASPLPPQQLGTTLRILALDPETPDATSINDVVIDLNGRNADGFYLYEKDDQSSAIITASGGGYWSYWGQPAAFSGLQSVIAKVDVSDAATAALTDTFTIDGQIISSRRIGDSLFFASRYYPAIPGIQPWGQNQDDWREAVEAADLATLMPEFSRNGSDESTPLVDAAACFVTPGSADQPYYSPDIITLGVIDLSTMQLRDSECFLGATETLYANTESVFLATTQYDYSQGPVTTDGIPVDTNIDVFPQDIIWFDPRQTTEIHRFDIQSDQLSYTGSGSVRGHLGWNELQKPFRMSERDGYLRIATMNDQQGPEQSPILLNVLQADGQGNLQTVSTLPNEANPEHIGKPGERLYASRFLGDRAYLVTFRQTDPLYLIDLADPANPQVTGELEIEGYSDYLHPVGEDHLLGIGKNAVAAEFGFGDGRGAWVQGIKLSLFDVSDPTDPTEVQSVLLGERGTDSVALRNHRAITIQPANDLHPMRISFGADVYGEAMPESSPAPDQATQYSPWNYTGLHGFDVTAGANASITPRGALIIERNNGSNWSSYGDDRSVMVNDAVFYIHGRNVYPALWDNLSNEPIPR